MEKRLLGRTGMWVSAIGLGTGQFGAFGQIEEADCLRMAHAAFDGGVTLVDTADFYSFGQSEEITAKAIAGRRDKLILATKCGYALSDDPNERGGSRRWIMQAIDASLRRLKTDYVDLYQLHVPDPATPIEETVDAFNDLMRAGKIRHFGFSNSSAVGIVTGALGARLRGQSGPFSEQTQYSILTRGPEAELLPACIAHGLGFLAYSPLEGGWLSGRYRKGRAAEASARQRLTPSRWDLSLPENQAKLDAADRLATLAEEAGIEPAHMAMAFVLAHRGVTAALIGGSRVAQIEAHMAGQDVVLSDAMLDRIDEIVAPGKTISAAEGQFAALADRDMRRRPRNLQPQESRASAAHIRNLVKSEGSG